MGGHISLRQMFQLRTADFVKDNYTPNQVTAAPDSHMVVHQDGHEQVHQRCQRHKKIEPIPPTKFVARRIEQRDDTLGLGVGLGFRPNTVECA